MSYPRDAAINWYISEDTPDNQRAILRQVIRDANSGDLSIWKSYESLANTGFRCSKKRSTTSPCIDCEAMLRFYRFGPKRDFVIWECPACHELWISNAVTQGPDQYDSLGIKSRLPIHANPDLAGDYRINAINEVLRDESASDDDFMTCAALWFANRTSLDEYWSQITPTASRMAPAPDSCTECDSTRFRLWRIDQEPVMARWQCEQCGRIVTVDQWTGVARILQEHGATPEQLAEIREDATREGLTPNDVADQFLHLYKLQVAEQHLSPPDSCPKCRETEFEFVDLASSGSAAKWKCSFCGRIELVLAGNDKQTTQHREPIPKAVQTEVWRRDEGKCTNCGSNENLEFDHIIPLARGGSNTARNIQLLCEKCNRAKHANEPGDY